jgi:hypothetical protein
MKTRILALLAIVLLPAADAATTIVVLPPGYHLDGFDAPPGTLVEPGMKLGSAVLSFTGPPGSVVYRIRDAANNTQVLAVDLHTDAKQLEARLLELEARLLHLQGQLGNQTQQVAETRAILDYVRSAADEAGQAARAAEARARDAINSVQSIPAPDLGPLQKGLAEVQEHQQKTAGTAQLAVALGVLTLLGIVIVAVVLVLAVRRSDDGEDDGPQGGPTPHTLAPMAAPVPAPAAPAPVALRQVHPYGYPPMPPETPAPLAPATPAATPTPAPDTAPAPSLPPAAPVPPAAPPAVEPAITDAQVAAWLAAHGKAGGAG